MLRSLLHYQSSTLLGLIGLAALAISFKAYAEINPLSASSPVSTIDVGVMSSEELLANAAQLNLANNPLDEAEMNQRLMNARWLEEGMVEVTEYQEGNEALEELAENALKSYWQALIERDNGYNRYTPVVEGNFQRSSRSGADYGVRLSGDTLKFRVKYTF